MKGRCISTRVWNYCEFPKAFNIINSVVQPKVCFEARAARAKAQASEASRDKFDVLEASELQFDIYV